MEKEVETKYGHTMIVDPDDYIGRKIIRKGIYDERGLSFVTSLLRSIKARNVLDVGANIGNHALVYSCYCEHVWCFEPNPKAYGLLAKNIDVNLATNISVQNFGLSDDDSTKTLYVQESGNLGASTLRRESREEEREYTEVPVSLRAGDKWVDENTLSGIDFIKMDVEGHEEYVIRGLARVIQNNRPFLLMEWSDESSDKQGIRKSNLFEDVFEDYSIYGLFVNTERAYWRRKVFGGVRRIGEKLRGKRLWCTPFSPGNSIGIRDLLLVPNEKGLPASCTSKLM